MLKWALIFLVISLITGFLGLGRRELGSDHQVDGVLSAELQVDVGGREAALGKRLGRPAEARDRHRRHWLSDESSPSRRDTRNDREAGPGAGALDAGGRPDAGL